MFSFAARVALSALLATTAMAQTFQIDTPLSVVVCQPALLTWHGGTAPYFLSILPAGQPTAPALLDLGSQSGNSVTWVANLGVGTNGFLNLRDSTGTLAQSGPFTVQSGTNTSCVGQTPVTSAGPGGAGGGGQSPASSTSSGSTSGSTTASATKSGAPSTSPSSAAISQYAPAGAAAMVGAALLALVA